MELIGTKTVGGRYLISNHHFNISMSFSGASIEVSGGIIDNIGSYGVNQADIVEIDGNTFIGIFGFEEISDVETNAMYCKPFKSEGVNDGF